MKLNFLDVYRYPIRQIAESFSPRRSGFEVTITVSGFEFTVEATDNLDASGGPLGKLKDPDRNFRTGATGLIAQEGEKIEIERFSIKPQLKAVP